MKRLRENVAAKLAITVGVSAAVAVAAAIAFGAGAARADDASYLADLQARGVPFLVPAQAVHDGYRVCSDIRNGEPPQIVAQSFGIYYNAVGPTIVDIAQRNLCPDTLQHDRKEVVS
ncbi:DUF732 domain-containing protein [Mycobacterium intracellulare]|uniref:DUF732 domain-containing protein n=1 Tax=Mycobacterium intracellulare TaxID=1767 RepID=UPI000CE2D57F|nr:DUF732 domain-containing protein [Mycobacterium intracellulare]